MTGGLISGVVKSECYGHGLALVKYVEDELDWFSVSSLDEAVALRRLEVQKPIHVLGCLPEISVDQPIVAGVFDCHYGLVDFTSNNIILTVADLQSFLPIYKMQRTITIDIEINTGMNRTGVTPREFATIVSLIFSCKHITLRGVFTHFADGSDLKFCIKQLNMFEKITKNLPKEIIRHCSATNFCKLPKKFYKDAIRLGLGMYGYGGEEFEPALDAGGRVIQINQIKAGGRIGYGNNIIEKDTRTATVDFGYGDGVPRSLSHRNGKIAVNGQLFEIVGTVCMDMTMIEIDDADVSTGDKAYYISKYNDAAQIAKDAGTIEYEILTGVNLRSKYCYR